MREDKKRCEAVTTKGNRCKKEAVFYRIYEGDRQEYLSCKLHHKYFKPHPTLARERQQAKG